MTNAFLKGFAAFLPDGVVTNQEVAARVGKTAEWIEAASGIRERRWAEPETTVADLAVAAGEKCLRHSANKPAMVMVASGSAAPGFPGPAAEVASRLGCENAAAIDLPMASAGSLFGMVMAAHMAQSVGEILVIGAEKMSAVLAVGAAEPDPNTEILFGDGAGAVLVSPTSGRWQILDSALHSDGAFRESLAFDWLSPLKMNGLSVILQASRKIPAAIQEVLLRQQIAAVDVSAFLMHQANQNLILRVAKALEVPGERFYSNIARYGNTSSASMLIAAAEWAETNPADGPIVFAAFGAGFHWGALVASSV